MSAGGGTRTAAATVGGRARALRLSPVAAQRAFRSLLDTLAQPGTLARLEIPPGVPPALLPVAVLADVEVAVAVLGGEPGWAEAAQAATGARTAAAAGDADLVVALRPLQAGDVRALRRGSALQPEQGARLVAACEALGPAAEGWAALVLELSGPGVDGTCRLPVAGLPAEAAAALREVNAGFPAGVDLHLVAADGTTAAVPRSSTIQIHTRNEERS